MIQVANLVDLKTVYIGKGVPFILRAIISKHIISHEKNEYNPSRGNMQEPLSTSVLRLCKATSTFWGVKTKTNEDDQYMLVTSVVDMSNKISLNILDSCIYTTSE